MELKIAMVQMLVEPGKISDNLSRATLYIKEAAAKGANCVVLPECVDIGWAATSYLHLALPIPGSTADYFQKAARENNIAIVTGITEKDGNDFYNASIFISSSGEIMGKHRKISLVPGVEDGYKPGSSLSIVNTPLGKIGITICADNLMSSIVFAKSLALMGAKLILSPSAWGVPQEKFGTPYGDEWRTPYTLLAAKYGISVIGVSNVGHILEGAWGGWCCIGNSIAVTDNGNTVINLSYGTEELRIISVSL